MVRFLAYRITHNGKCFKIGNDMLHLPVNLHEMKIVAQIFITNISKNEPKDNIN